MADRQISPNKALSTFFLASFLFSFTAAPWTAPSAHSAPATSAQVKAIGQAGDCLLLQGKSLQSKIAKLKKVPCTANHNVEVFRVGRLPSSLDPFNLAQVEYGGIEIERCSRPDMAPDQLNFIRMTISKPGTSKNKRTWFRCEIFQLSDSGSFLTWRGKKITSSS